MSASEVRWLAEFLAAHAVILLGVALLTGAAAFAAVVGALRMLRRRGPALRRIYTRGWEYARRSAVISTAVARSRTLVPNSYLALYLLLGLALTAAVTIFVVIAENVIGGGELVTFDIAFAQALREQASPRWERVFAAVSWLGEREMLAAAAAAVAARLLFVHGVVVAIWWIAAQAGGGVLNLALKEAFERTRPAFAESSPAISGWSFPSGHAMGTFILCGLGCYLLLRQVRSWTVAAIAAIVALAWCAVMAFSRLYLGVHFASDVIAGIVAGAGWVAVCAAGFEVVRRGGDQRPGRA